MKKVGHFFKSVKDRIVNGINTACNFLVTAHDIGVQAIKEYGPVRAILANGTETGRGGRRGGGGGSRAGGMDSILSFVLVGSVAIIILMNMFGMFQDQNQVIQGDTHTDAGTTGAKNIFGMLIWLFPLGIGVAILIKTFRH